MKDFFKYVLATIVGILLASIVSGILGVLVLVGIAATADKPAEVKDNSLLHLNLSGEIVERKIDNPLESLPIFGDQKKVIGLNQILEALDKAERDANIEGVFLQTGMMSVGLATGEEIRNALMRFQESGKYIISYSGTYSQAGYFIASVADELYVNPQGMIDIRGFSSQRMFYRSMLEKLDIEPTIIRVGKYKSAVEPFLRDEMSEASREQTKFMLDAYWGNYLNMVSASRDIPKKQLDAYAAEATAFLEQKKYVDFKLADGLKYYDEVEAILLEKTGQEEDDKLKLVSLKNYASAVVENKELKGVRDRVAVIYANGGIDTGNEGINSSKLISTIEKVRKNDKIKAVVLRVNSPGGSAYGSEQIWRFMGKLKEEKPVVVSMGDYAASGGYYIACNADTIIADKNTLTGSIGIFGVFMNMEGLAGKAGLTFDRVKVHQYSDVMSATRSVTPEEKALMQGWINRGYKTFITRCADGREKTFDEIDAVASGRVWAAEHAKNHDLIDSYGDLHKAIEIAGEMADLDKFKTSYYPKEKTFMEQIMADLQGSAQKVIGRSVLGEHYKVAEQIKVLEKQSGMQARMPFELKVY